jgi:hypothetical protein
MINEMGGLFHVNTVNHKSLTKNYMLQTLAIQALISVLFKFLTTDKLRTFVGDVLKSAKTSISGKPNLEAPLLPVMAYLAQVLSLNDSKLAAEFSPTGKGQQMVFALLNEVLTTLGSDAGKHFADAALDKIELAVHRSASRVDDKLVLPFVNFLRSSFDIPDFADAPAPATVNPL